MKQLTIKQMEAIDNMFEYVNNGNEYIIYIHSMTIGYPHRNDEPSILLRAMHKIKEGIKTVERSKYNKEEDNG